MYPQRQPDLKLVKFDTLQSLAEAAEKYLVFAAMATCKTFMEYVSYLMILAHCKYPSDHLSRPAYKEHPLEVLIYAAKHDYPEIANAAAKEVLKLPFQDVLRGLLPEIAVYVAYVCIKTSF